MPKFMQLLGEFNLNVVKNKYPVSYGDAMNALLTQEMARFNRYFNYLIHSMIIIYF